MRKAIKKSTIMAVVFFVLSFAFVNGLDMIQEETIAWMDNTAYTLFLTVFLFILWSMSHYRMQKYYGDT